MLRGPSPAGPDSVGVSVDDGLGLVRRSRGEHDPERQERLDRAAWPRRGLGEQVVERLELQARQVYRLVGVGAGDCDPPQLRSRACHHRRVPRLGDRRHALCLVDEVGDLGGDRLGVGRDPDRADGGAGQPGQKQLGGIVGVQEHLVTPAHSSPDETGSQSAGVVQQLSVGPTATPAAWRVPDEHRVLGAVFGPVGEQPGDVLAVHLKLLECVAVHTRSISRNQRIVHDNVGEDCSCAWM